MNGDTATVNDDEPVDADQHGYVHYLAAQHTAIGIISKKNPGVNANDFYCNANNKTGKYKKKEIYILLLLCPNQQFKGQ